VRSNASATLILAFALSLTACATAPPDPLAEAPSAETLYAEGVDLLEGRWILFVFHSVDYDKAIERFQAIIDNYPYSDFAVMAELKIADAYFAQEKYTEAHSYYRDFAELHPNHEKIPYTIFQAGNSHYRMTRSAERDQTPTRQALAYYEQLMTRFPDAPEAREAEPIWRELRTVLADSVMIVADFYFEREEYQAAADRYREVLNDYPGLGLDAHALYQLGLSYSRMNRDEEAMKIFQVILENYEGSDVARAAADHVFAAN
jgi:outer membrane protein assembly factor BamD